MRRAAIALAILAAIGSIATLIAHEGARAEWERERAAQGSERYDPARSDAAWDRAHARRAWAERAAILAAIALVVAAACSGPRGEGAAAGSDASVLASTAIDAMGVAGAIGIGRAASAIPSSPALADALAWWLPAIPLAAHAALLARGATLGMRIAHVRIARPAPWRAVVAALATPLVAIALPIVAVGWMLGRRWPAPHLSIAAIPVPRSRA